MKRALVVCCVLAAACGGGGDDDGVDGASDGASFDSRRVTDGGLPDAFDHDAPLLDAVIGGPDAPIDGPLTLPDGSIALPDGSITLPDALVAGADGPVAACTSLSPGDDASGAARRALIISEIDPGTFIEVYNASAAAIDLGTSLAWFCSPFTYASMATLGAGITLAPGGRAALPWPVGFTDTDAGGEVILYVDSAFAASTSVMDFVCWGTNPHSSRKATAEAGGKWDGGACAGALTAGSLKRLASTTGTHAADYDVATAPTPQTCSP